MVSWAVAEIQRAARPEWSGLRRYDGGEGAVDRYPHRLRPALPDRLRRQDVRHFEAIRRAVGDEVAIGVDPNTGWSLTDSLCAIEALRPFGLGYIEQPVARRDLEGMAEIRRAALTGDCPAEAPRLTGGERRGPAGRRALARPDRCRIRRRGFPRYHLHHGNAPDSPPAIRTPSATSIIPWAAYCRSLKLQGVSSRT